MMKRRSAALLSGIAAAAVLGFSSSVVPASAHTGVCAGSGTLTTSAPFLYLTPTDFLGLAHATTTLFGLSFLTLGECQPAKPGGLTATGAMSGWCDLSSGEGTTGDGHRFAFLGAGSFLIFTGELVGVVNAIPNAIAGENCLQPGADQFLVTGVATLVHCTITKGKGLTDMSMLFLGWHVWTKACA